MKKIIACLLISVVLTLHIIPITSAYADVVVDDNDEIIIDSNTIELGKRFATMTTLENLLESGVSSISWSDVSDLDDYIDNLWDEIDNALDTCADYLITGDLPEGVSASDMPQIYTNITKMKDWITENGLYYATTLFSQSNGNVATGLLADFFDGVPDGIVTKIPRKFYSGSLDGVRSLGILNQRQQQPQPDLNYSSYIDAINGQGWTAIRSNVIPLTFGSGYTTPNVDMDSVSWHSPTRTATGITTSWNSYQFSNIYDIVITSYNGVYSCVYNPTYLQCFLIAGGQYNTYANYGQLFQGKYLYNQYGNTTVNSQTFTGTLEQVLSSLSARCRHCNIYVDGVLWSSVGSSPNAPTLNIDGMLKLEGNNQPVEYYYPSDIEIDYNKLYEVMYNAIRDNLPLDIQSVTNNNVYNDSHDNIYSPTIYNYYGGDDESEKDLIDSLLDYALVPTFNTAMLAPIEQPFQNGLIVYVNAIQDVVPKEILLVFGGIAVLGLFVIIMNRMME